MKYINFKRYKFSRFFKNINFSRYNFLKLFKLVNFARFDFKKASKYIDVRRIDFTRFANYSYLKRYSFSLIKNISILRSKFFLIHLPVSIIFFGFLYLFIPTFFTYEKSELQNFICKNKKINCVIKGDISYNFYPTPRIKIKDLTIYHVAKKKSKLITIENAAVKLSIKNLLTKDRHEFKKIELYNYKINFDLKKLKMYPKILVRSVNYIPVKLSNGQIIFFDGDDYVVTINDVDLVLKTDRDFMEGKLKGKFLNEDIKINFDSKIIDHEKLTNIILKMSD